MNATMIVDGVVFQVMEIALVPGGLRFTSWPRSAPGPRYEGSVYVYDGNGALVVGGGKPVLPEMSKKERRRGAAYSLTYDLQLSIEKEPE